MNGSINWAALRNEIAEVTREAVLDYKAMSSLGAWDAPEFWIQCKIAEKLRDRFYVMLEAPVNRVLEWASSDRTSKQQPEPDVRAGRIDLALYEKTPRPEEASVLALIEVKKYAQRFDCADDVIRLRGLGPILGLQAGFMVAHVQNGNPKEVQRSVKELLDDIKGDTKAVVRASDISFSDGHDNYHCAAVVADVFP